MKFKIFGVLIILVALINSATAGNVAPATAVIEDTNLDGIMGCSDTLKLSFHTSSPWTIELNAAPFLNGTGPDDTIVETIQHENTQVIIPLNSPPFVCDADNPDILTLSSSVPQEGYSDFYVKFPTKSFIPGDSFTFTESGWWQHEDPQEPTVGGNPPIPEASTMVLFALGILGIVVVTKKGK